MNKIISTIFIGILGMKNYVEVRFFIIVLLEFLKFNYLRFEIKELIVIYLF